MEYKIKELIRSFFRTVPDNPQMRALRTELTRKMTRRYYDYISSGKTPGEAYDAILASAQEIKDRIADAMRNVRAAHTAPPFGSAPYAARSYNAQNQSTAQSRPGQNPRTASAQPEQNRSKPRPQSAAGKPGKKGISALGTVVISLLGTAMLVLAACLIFFTMRYFSQVPRRVPDVQPSRSIEASSASEDMPEQDDTAIIETSDDSTIFVDEAQSYRDLEQSFSEDGAYAIDAAHLSEVDVLELLWPSGNVQLHIYDGADFLLQESAESGVSQQQALRCGLDGNTLFVQYCSPQAIATPLPVKDLEIWIPQTLADAAVNAEFTLDDASLEIDGLCFNAARFHTRSGPVTAHELSVTGPLIVESVSADAALSGVLPDVSFTSESGSLRLEGDDGLTNLNARTQSGNLDISARIHRLDAATYGGNVRIQAPICPYALDITTRSGDVSLHLPAASDFTLDFHSGSGNFLSGLSVVEARGAYVRGDGIANLRIDTASGDLQIFEYKPD